MNQKSVANMPVHEPVWKVQMLGSLRLVSVDGAQNTMRFRTQTTGSLLAYLAYHQGAPISRDVVIDAIWPDLSLDAGRSRLNVATSTLRVQLSHLPLTSSDIFIADKSHIGLCPNIVTTDVALFEDSLRRAETSGDTVSRISALDAAIALYGGDLLSGRYEGWIEFEQERLRLRYETALSERENLLAGSILRERARPGSFKNGSVNFAPLPVGKHTLPVLMTRFFGRQREMEHLTNLLYAPYNQTEGKSALVTLTGIGGIGKTRLALETARRLLAPFDGRVWSAELAAARNAQQVWTIIRDALGLAKEDAGNAPQQVITALIDAPALLLLDNMEQFVDSGEAALIVDELMEKVPHLSLLVTSRQALDVEGERVFPLGSLLTGSAWDGLEMSDPATSQFAASQAALDLFADRARAVRAGFVVTDANEMVVRQLCETLDGIPLAIELAAARLNVMSPKQLLVHLEQRFLMLKSLRTDIPVRHRSLHAAIETSYDLLSRELQRVLRALSVFRGGWTIAAASAVCGLEISDVWDAMSELSARSFIQGTGEEDALRFRMLETIREFAALRLVESRESESAWERHRQFFTDMAVSAAPYIELGGKDAQDWLDLLEADHANLRAALDAPTPPEQVLKLPNGLYRFWFLRGFATEGKYHLQHSLSTAGVSCLKYEIGQAWNNLGAISWAAGILTDAQLAFEQALQIYRESGNAFKTASALNNLGIIFSQNGYFESGRTSYIECLEIYRQLGDTVRQSAALTNLGAMLMYQGFFQEARLALEEALEFQRTAGDKTSVLRTLNTLAELSIRQGDQNSAIVAVLGGLQIRQEIGDMSTLWEPFTTAANVLSRGTAHYEAAVLWGAIQSLREDHGLNAVPVDVSEEREIVARFHLMLGGVDAAESAQCLGRKMDVHEAVQFACTSLEKARPPTNYKSKNW